MYGPNIIARSISEQRIKDKHGNLWQYHSQSDRHSKIACWAILFDFLLESPLLREHIKAEKVGFGINHELRDFQTGRKKNLDLVVCTPNKSNPPKVKIGSNTKKPVGNFVDLAADYEIVLDAVETSELAKLPDFSIVTVASVNVALEAKATMTEHIKALPRLHDELDSSHLTVHGHSDHAIAAGLVMINSSGSFLSPGRHPFSVATGGTTPTIHKQPKATIRVIDKVLEIRRRSGLGQAGFDAVGIVLVDFANDMTPCAVVAEPPAPTFSDSYHYNQMITRLASLYAAKFNGL